MAVLRSAQGKAIVGGLPQSQANEALLKRVIDFRPKRTHNIFAGGRVIAKFLGLEVEMFVAPRGERASQSVAQFFKIRQRTRTLVIFTANCRLCDIAMT